MKKTLLFVVFISLGGCAPLAPPYEPSKIEGAPIIWFEKISPGIGFIEVAPCCMYISRLTFFDEEGVKRRLSDKTIVSLTTKPLVFTPNKEKVINMVYLRKIPKTARDIDLDQYRYVSCTVEFSFFPAEGQTYRIAPKINKYDKKCRLSVSRKTQSNSWVAEDTFKIIRWGEIVSDRIDQEKVLR